MKPRIFISYARPDEEVVSDIHRRLEEAGYDAWLDRVDLVAGTEWRNEIFRAIRQSDVFLAMLSQNSVERGGILRGELREAMSLREEVLGRRAVVIPVRLEECSTPPELRDIQWVNWFAPDGWDRLTRALDAIEPEPPPRSRRVRAAVIGVAVVAVLAAAYAAWRWRVSGVPDDAAAFVQSRPGGDLAGAPGAAPRIGVTVWQVREAAGAGTGPCSGLELVRVPLDHKFAWGDAVRIGIESSRRGYLYLLASEMVGGRSQPAEVIFPTTRLDSGANLVEPGRLVQIPPAERCASLRLERSGPAHQGERLRIVLAPSPIADLPAAAEPYMVPEAVARRISGSAVGPPRGVSIDNLLGKPRSRAEDEAEEGTRRLRWNEPAPETIFTFPDEPGRMVVAEFSINAGP